jgi:RNA polymerase sigma-70 factor (ECF subfamily)
MSDLALARRLLAGDQTALDEFVREYLPRLYRFACVRLAGNDDAAEEVVQAAMTKAIEKLHTYRGEAAMFTWLCALCRREIGEWQMRTGSRAEIALMEDEPRTRATLDALAALTGNDPETQLQRSEISRLVQVTLDHLPGRYADALEWRYMQGLSVDEIATRLGLGYKAAESLLTRARHAFRDGFPSGAVGPARGDLWPIRPSER